MSRRYFKHGDASGRCLGCGVVRWEHKNDETGDLACPEGSRFRPRDEPPRFRHRPTGVPRSRSYCIGTIFGFTKADLQEMIA